MFLRRPCGRLGRAGPRPGADDEHLPDAADRDRTPELSGPDTGLWLRALLEHAGEGPIGVTGYCLGARLAVRAAAALPGAVGAVGGFHGGVLVADEPDSPHPLIGSTTGSSPSATPTRDPSMPSEAVAALEEALTAAGRAHLDEVYERCRARLLHGRTSAYDERAAERPFHEPRRLLDRVLLPG